MDAVDSWIPDPVRDIDKPFLMAVEDVMTISGRGTVATGRVERGEAHLNEEVEIVGIKPTQKTVITGLEMFHKQLDVAQAGDDGPHDELCQNGIGHPLTEGLADFV